MTTVSMPALTWGSPAANMRALLVHGLGSDAHTMWRIGEAFAEWGWCAVAVDLRGHGDAPRTTTYRIEDFARDVLAIPRERPWSVALGHSIAGAALVTAGVIEPDFTDRLVLVDPALATTEAERDQIRANQLANHDGNTVDKQRAAFPHWHELDVELSVAANSRASRFALEHAVLDNPEWDVVEEAKRLTIPTYVIQGDPAVMARYSNAHGDAIERANPLVTRTTITGAGHNVHRDAPDEFIEALGRWVCS